MSDKTTEQVIVEQLIILERMARLRDRLTESAAITFEDSETMSNAMNIIIIDTLSMAAPIGKADDVLAAAERLRNI